MYALSVESGNVKIQNTIQNEYGIRLIYLFSVLPTLFLRVKTLGLGVSFPTESCCILLKVRTIRIIEDRFWLAIVAA